MENSSLVRAALFLLFVLAQAAPAAWAGLNLRVDGVSISTNPANAGSTVQFTATVTNTGDDVTVALVQVYLSTNAVITTAEDQTIAGTQSPILFPGQTATVTQPVVLPSNLATDDYFLGTIVTGWSADVDMSDNTGATGVSVIGATCARDDYEQNDTFAAARAVPLNQLQSHNYCDDPDDWVSFQAVAGTTYGIQTAKIGYAFTWQTLALFAADGTQLASAPDPYYNDNPKIVWTAPVSGTYYVRSRPLYQWHATGVGTEYNMVIADVLPDLMMPFSDTQLVKGVAGGTSWFYTAVANHGFTDSGPFDVGVYLSTDPVVTRDDMRIGYRRVEGLVPSQNGSSIANVFIAFPGTLPAGNYYVAAIADDTDRVPEYQEGNNTSEVAPASITGPSCTPDGYEDDDVREMARPVVLNEQQTHNFCEDGFDWFRFDAVAGKTYYARAMYPTTYPGGPGSPAATVEIYDADGQKLTEGSGVASWTPAAAGRYYIRANGGLSASNYSFGVLDQLPDLSAVSYWSMDTGAVPRGGVIDDASYMVGNFGFIDSPPSMLGYYFSGDTVITQTDQLLHTVPVTGIAPLETVTKTFVRVPVPAALATGTYRFGNLADAGNAIVEFDEANNGAFIRDLDVIDPPCAPDGYDDDDVPGQARPLPLNEVQNRNFCEDGYDWVSVDLQGGQTYALETRGDLASKVRPVIYDTEGRNVLVDGETGYIDSNFVGWAAFTAPAAGRYYALATNLDQWGYRTSWGEYKNYTLRMTTCQPDAYEQDDANGAAGQPIAVGGSQARNHCEDGVDWAVLTLGAPARLTIATSGLGSTADTRIDLYAASGGSALMFNDDQSPNNKASSISYDFTVAGTYYIKVTGKQRGAGTEYTLSVQPAKGRK